VLSSRTERDAGEYVGVLESVYGELDVTATSSKPGFLKQIPKIVGLERTPADVPEAASLRKPKFVILYPRKI